MRSGVASALVATALLVARSSSAGGDADARLAQALFDEGRRLMDQQRWSEACPKLAESQRLDPGGGTLLNLALCHASEGRVATALVEYHAALAAATRDGRRDRESLARSSIASLERDVPRLTVIVSEAAAQSEGLEVKLDETVLPRAAWGTSMPIDPGAHTVSATVPGRTPWSSILSLRVAELRSVEVPALGSLQSVPLPAPPAEVGPAPERVADPPRIETRANPVFWGVFGATLAAAGTMVVTGAMALSKKSDANDGCLPDRNFCRDTASADAADSARALGWVSTGALAVAVVGTIALFIIPSRLRVAPSRVGVGGLGLRGTF